MIFTNKVLQSSNKQYWAHDSYVTEIVICKMLKQWEAMLSIIVLIAQSIRIILLLWMLVIMHLIVEYKLFRIAEVFSELGKNVFNNCQDLTRIEFNGTKSVFKSIKKPAIGDKWYKGSNIIEVICTDGTIEKENFSFLKTFCRVV